MPKVKVKNKKQERRGKFAIDKHNLDEELVRQVEFMEQYTEEYADRDHELTLAKEALSELESSLGMKIRENYREYGLEKVTEGGVQAVLYSKKAYKKAREAVIAAEYAANQAKSKVTTLSGRRSALSKLCDLWMMSYFSEVEPGSSKSFKDAKLAQRAQEEITGKLKSKRRRKQEDEDDDD